MNASGIHAYGRYEIRTLAVAGKVRARALLARKRVGDAEGASLDEALGALRTLLDQRDMHLRTARMDGVPSSEEFAEAFACLGSKVGAHHWVMLKALLAAPGRTRTATELAAAAGYPSFASANEKFGKLGRMVAEELGYDPERRADGTIIWTTTLATGVPTSGQDGDGLWRWTMRPEVADCLLQMNVGAPLSAR